MTTQAPFGVWLAIPNKAHAPRLDYPPFLILRLSECALTECVERYLLKGALLFDLWFDVPHRPTRDADLLAPGLAELPALESVFRELCTGKVEPDDGVRFQAEISGDWV